MLKIIREQTLGGYRIYVDGILDVVNGVCILDIEDSYSSNPPLKIYNFRTVDGRTFRKFNEAKKYSMWRLIGKLKQKRKL